MEALRHIYDAGPLAEELTGKKVGAVPAGRKPTPRRKPTAKAKARKKK